MTSGDVPVVFSAYLLGHEVCFSTWPLSGFRKMQMLHDKNNLTVSVEDCRKKIRVYNAEDDLTEVESLSGSI